ncbi:MAG: PAS domain S-box protein, partial [Bacteroidales bacterium]|nr:PAS domain S-box protein [Bacteroidales bacterium]
MKNRYSTRPIREPVVVPSCRMCATWLSLGGLLAAMAVLIPEKSDVLAAALIVGIITLIGQRIDYYRYTKLWLQHDRRIRQALDTARTIAWEMNPVTGEVFRTGSLASWLNLDPSITLNNLSESLAWVHPDDRALVESSVRNIVVTGREHVTEFRMFRADGNLLRILTHYRAEGEIGQPPRYIYGVHIDITDRKRSDERLRLLESVVVHAQEAVVILDAAPASPQQGRSVIYVNDAFCRMTEYEREEVIGRSLHFLRGPESDQETLETIRAALDSGSPLQVELQNYRKNGSSYWVELSLVPVQTTPDLLSHWVMIQRDISDRKSAEEALRASERAFRRMADVAPAMLWETNATGETTFLSRGWYEFIGQTPHAEPADRLVVGIHADDQERVRQFRQSCVVACVPYSVEYRLQRPHSGYSWVVEAGRPW